MKKSTAFILQMIFFCVARITFSGEPIDSWTDQFSGIRFVKIPAGQFEMGSPVSEQQRNPDEIIHRVAISHSFYLGEHEVTQSQWKRVMGNSPSNFHKCGRDCPVEKINWYQVNQFITSLNQHGNAVFRLPTEAEWEYACRAGSQTPFSTGEKLTTADANYDGHYPYTKFPKGKNRGATSPVGSYSPNAWGLFDMHGNVWEWTSDFYCPYSNKEVVDPKSVCVSKYKVIRGGSWYFGADSARCALRYTHEPHDSGFSLGFRIVAEIH